MSAEEDNRALWNDLLKGNKQSLFDLYNNTYFHLLRFGLKICSDNELVMDCVNQLFLHIWDKRQRLQPVQQVQSYLFTTLRRIILDQIAHQSRIDLAIGRMLDEDEPNVTSYEEILIRSQGDQETMQRLHNALTKLSPKQKEFVRLKFFEGLSYEEIAEMHTQTIKTCYNVIYDAIKVLKKTLVSSFHDK
ncbi:MAG: RNA polymerase sigma factor [Arcticibacter sp.]